MLTNANSEEDTISVLPVNCDYMSQLSALTTPIALEKNKFIGKVSTRCLLDCIINLCYNFSNFKKAQ